MCVAPIQARLTDLVVSFGGDKSELGGLREYVARGGVDEGLLFFSNG